MIERRNERLAAEYREMLRIQNRPYLSWIVTKGEPPYAEEYLLDVRLRTYVFSQKSGVCTVGAIRRCTIKVSLWDSYPIASPNIRMLNIPPVFHPDWYSKGTYCPPTPWRPDDTLKDYILRMLDALRYPTSMREYETPANYKAFDWYRKNKDNPALFPADRTELSENTPQETDAVENAAVPYDEVVDSWTIG